MIASRDYLLARLSEAIYEDWPTVKERAGALGFVVLNIWDHADSQGMLVEGRDFYAIVFRGTEASKFNIRDLFSNLGHPTKWMGEGRVHAGYVRHLDRIVISVFDFAKRVDSSVPLYMAGHSLGGAVASLAASLYYTLRPDWKLAGLVTFGAPKSMDKEAGSAIRCSIFRLVMPMDFAPWWPPSLWLSHPAKPIRLKAKSWWPGPVSRHMISEYIKSLK